MLKNGWNGEFDVYFATVSYEHLQIYIFYFLIVDAKLLHQVS